MARRYYNTKEKIYQLLKNHPSSMPIINGLQISDSKVMDVASFLLLHYNEIVETPLNMYYNDSDLIDNIAELYGFTIKPWTQYITTGNLSLLELLHLTLYLYKFGVTDNFYEKNILDFIPEYDRDQILNTPKLKLTVESLGRKLDQMEDAIIRISELYDIDKCPDEFLDYLGQNIGYEREDFTLSSVSFRELLKNIIEIYKIKGTNYSFSFFFKFLGFEINLKEFYFNRDVQNPEAFPGMTELNVEYYLSTTNPIMETGKPSQGIVLYPATHLEQIRNLDDWKIELNSLTANGCINPIPYMLGKETYNNDDLTWHKNPWKYFKTNLIEYNLEPFINKVNLTSSDNETIKKYVKFLSPTYLFTWINVNLRPWIEDVNIVIDDNDKWIREVFKTLGDPRPTPNPWPMFAQGTPGIPIHPEGTPWVRKTNQDPGFTGPYKDYEDMFNDILIFNQGGENLLLEVIKKLNLDGADQWGTILRHDGEDTRQPGNPKHISNAFHRADKRLCFDSLDLKIKGVSQTEYVDYSSQPFPAIPLDIHPFIGQTIADINTISINWANIFNSSEYWIQIAINNAFEDTDEWREKYLIADSKVFTNLYNHPDLVSNNLYYWRIRTRNILNNYYTEDQSDDWFRYTQINGTYIHNTGWGPWSNTYYFNVKTLPFPYNGEIINKETKYVSPLYQWDDTRTKQIFISASFSILLNPILRTEFYEIEFIESGNIVKTFTPSYTSSFTNGSYSWRYRAKNIDGVYGNWSDTYTFTVDFQTVIE